MHSLVAWLLLLVVAAATGQEAVPQTAFSCEGRPYGYYADIEANCQTFHVCMDDFKWSFLCPNQTVFNQEYLVCDHAYNVDCSLALTLYTVNDGFGKVISDATEVPEE